MRSCLILLLGLGVLPSLVHGASISNTTRTTSGHLWTMATGNRDTLSLAIFTKLREYAIWCCLKKPPSKGNCNTMQLGYWAWVDARLTNDNQILAAVKNNFNPEDDPDYRCGFKTSSNKDYPLFSMVVNSQYTEAALIPRMKDRSIQNFPDIPTNFYLYSTNAPCGPTNCQGLPENCVNKIFDFTYDWIWINQFQQHFMYVGFWQWYTPDIVVKEGRKRYCNDLTNTKSPSNYPNVNFATGLFFKKIFSQKSKDGITDETFHDELA